MLMTTPDDKTPKTLRGRILLFVWSLVLLAIPPLVFWNFFLQKGKWGPTLDNVTMAQGLSADFGPIAMLGMGLAMLALTGMCWGIAGRAFLAAVQKPAQPPPIAKPDHYRMDMSFDSSSESATTRLQLALAWGFVGIPLLWGVYGTLVNALKLFQ
jgi:hypothetical protein